MPLNRSSLLQPLSRLTSDELTVLRLITASPTAEALTQSLSSARIPLTSPLIDRVLKHLRFSHADPTRALHFFSLSPSDHRTADSYDTVLYILGRSRRFQESWSLLKLMKSESPDLITHRTAQIVLARIAKVCSVRQTVDSFRKLRKLSAALFSDVSSFNALLRTLAQEKSMSDARNVYHSLKREFRPNLQTFNILLSGWKSVEDAESFYDEMSQLKVEPDVVTFNCLVDVYCKNRDVEKAREVIDRMTDREIYPDVITYTSLVGGLGLVGQPDKAREVLKEMREHGCQPDAAAYNAAIRNFCIAKRLGDAFGLMEEMNGKGLGPNATSYNLFFRCFYWSNDVESACRLYERMTEEGCLPNTQSCMFLARLFRRNERVGMALRLWGDMVEKDFGSFTLVSDVVLDLLCDAGKLEEAERCFYQMVEKGHRPSSLSFRRIKVLMELAGRHDSLAKLSESMTVFGHSTTPVNEQIAENSTRMRRF